MQDVAPDKHMRLLRRLTAMEVKQGASNMATVPHMKVQSEPSSTGTLKRTNDMIDTNPEEEQNPELQVH